MSTPKIVTVTLSPSLDRTLTTHYLHVDHHNIITEPTRLDPGGFGVNISRALHKLDCPTHAIILLGTDPIGRAYRALISEEAFPMSIIHRDGQTRSDTIIVDTGNGGETHLTEKQSTGTREDVQAVANLLEKVADPGDLVLCAGVLPPTPADAYTLIIEATHKTKAQVVVAPTRKETLEQALSANPEIAMLRQVTLEAFFNIPVRIYDDVVYCAEKLLEEGVSQILVSMDDMSSAILVTGENRWRVDRPEIVPQTSSGVIEALVAGFLVGHMKDNSLDEALKLGAAASVYTASHVGCEFGSFTEIRAVSNTHKFEAVRM